MSNSSDDDESSIFTRFKQLFTRSGHDKTSRIRQSLLEAYAQGVLPPDTYSMIEGVFHVSEMRVRDIMIPRSQMAVVNRNMPLNEILDIVISKAHSRYPVLADDRDEISGILLAKDLLSVLHNEDEDEFSLKDMLRPANCVPEAKRLNVLLNEFRENRNHMAIVIDEYGSIAGLVTIEDILEQIVGDIEDEHDFDESDLYILNREDGSYTVKAMVELREFNEYFGTDVFDTDEFDTIGGVVMHAFGHVPKRDEVVTVEDFRFKVIRADNRRIHSLLVVPLKGPDR